LADACGGKPPTMLQSSSGLQGKRWFIGERHPAASRPSRGVVMIAPATKAPSGTTNQYGSLRDE